MSSRTVVFVCLHGAAKSVIAAAHFERLAAERGLAVRAAAAGLEPDPAVPAPVVAGLAADGLDVGGHRPRRVTPEELAGAWRVVAFGCDPGPAVAGARLLRWDDVPAVSDGFAAARDAIVGRVRRLVDACAEAVRTPGRP
jgi:arsenate reductase